MDVKMLAAALLLGHFIAVIITILVLGRQVKILRRRPGPELQTGRWVLLALAVVIGLGNFIPIVIDTAVIAGSVVRAQPSAISIAYALSNVLTLVLSSSALLALYVTADRLTAKTPRQTLAIPRQSVHKGIRKRGVKCSEESS